MAVQLFSRGRLRLNLNSVDQHRLHGLYTESPTARVAVTLEKDIKSSAFLFFSILIYAFGLLAIVYAHWTEQGMK